MAVNRKFSNYNSDYDLITLLKVNDISTLPENIQHDLTGLNNICNVNKYLTHIYHILIGNNLNVESYEILSQLYRNALASLRISADDAYNNVNITDTHDYYDYDDKNALTYERMLSTLITGGVPNKNILKIMKLNDYGQYDNYIQKYVYSCMHCELYDNAYDNISTVLFRHDYEIQEILNIDNITVELDMTTVKNDVMLTSLMLNSKSPCGIMIDALKVNNNNMILLIIAFMMLQCYFFCMSTLNNKNGNPTENDILRADYAYYANGDYDDEFKDDLQLIIDIAGMFTYPFEYVFQNIELSMREYVESA